MGTYELTYAASATRVDGAEYSDAATYTFHVGPISELGVRDGGASPLAQAGQWAYTVKATSIGPDTAGAVKVTLTGVPRGATARLTDGEYREGACDGNVCKGVWDLGDLPVTDLVDSSGQPDLPTLTLIVGGPVDWQMQAAIASSEDYSVCIDSNLRDVAAASETACEATSGNSWHSTEYYDYRDNNNSARIAPHEGSDREPPPGQVQSFAAHAIELGILLEWDQLKVLNAYPVTHYEVRRESGTPVVETALADDWRGTMFLDRSPPAAEDEYLAYLVRAVNTQGVAGFWTRVVATDAPGLLTATLSASTDLIGKAGPDNVAELTVELGRELQAHESATVPLSFSGATAGAHFTLALKPGAGLNTAVRLVTGGPHSAQNPALVFSGPGARTATLLLTGVDDGTRTARPLTINYGSGDRAPTEGRSNRLLRLLPVGPLVVTIVDLPLVTLEAPTRVTEGESLTVTARVARALSGPLTIPIEVTGDTAGLMAPLPQSITIAAGATSRSVVIRTTTDPDDHDHETFTITLGTLPDSVSTTQQPLRVTVVDASRPTVGIEAISSSVVEGGAAEFLVTVNPALPAGQGLWIEFDVIENLADADLVSRGGFDPDPMTRTVRHLVGPGATSSVFEVRSTQDDVSEARGEKLTLRLPKNDLSYRQLVGEGGSPVQVEATVTVVDDDDDETTIYLRNAQGWEQPNATACVDIEVRGPLPSGGLYMEMAVADGTATATDYLKPRSRSVNIPAGVRTSQYCSYILDDGVDNTMEGDETFTVSIKERAGSSTVQASPQGFAGGETFKPRIGRGTATVTILATPPPQAQASPEQQQQPGGFDAPPPLPEVSVSAGNGVTEGGAATFTFSASPAPDSPIVVSLAVSQSGDYAASGTTGTKTVTIPTSGSATYSVATVDDTADEADGSVSVSLAAGQGYTLGSAATVVVAVSDNDDPPAQTPVVSIAAGSNVREGGSATFTVTASPAPTSPLTVSLSVSQSGDYAASGATGTKTVVIPTSGSATYSVATVDDTTDETDGSVTVAISGGNGYSVGSSSSASVSVSDDDAPATPSSCVTTDAALLSQVEAKVSTHATSGRDDLREMFSRSLETMKGNDTYTVADIKARPDKQGANWQGSGSNPLWQAIYAELDRLETCRANE